MTSSGLSSDAGSSSIAVADSTAMVSAEGSTHVGDWTQYPECMRSKECKLEDGHTWTNQLLEQRLDVLHHVRWCLCCGEVCHRKNTVKDNNGSAYPECNKTGVWKRVKYDRQTMNQRASEMRKLQREFAKRDNIPVKKKMRKFTGRVKYCFTHMWVYCPMLYEYRIRYTT